MKDAKPRTSEAAARPLGSPERDIQTTNLGVRSSKDQLTNYDSARRRARALGFDYVENELLLHQQPEARLERLETLVAKGLVNDTGARAALLGTEKRPAFLVSKLFDEYEAATKDEIKDLSPDQLRVWRNSRKRTVENLVVIIGDKPVNEITPDDAIDYCEWWRDRVIDDEVEVKTANKDIGQLSQMLKEMNVRRRLNLPDLFKGLRLKGPPNARAYPMTQSLSRTGFWRTAPWPA